MKHELKEQVALQCEVVARLCEIISAAHREMAAMFRSGEHPDALELAGASSTRLMKTLGEYLYGQDALGEGDGWIYDIFDEAEKLWPAEGA